MTKNLPAQINQAELDAFISDNRLSAEDLSGGGDFLPQLRIEYTDEVEFNGEKLEVKPGLFTLSGQEVPSYAKNVTFRPLLQTYQYINFDSVKKVVVNRSVLFNDFSEEARDELGTLRCGKPEGKVLRDNPSLKKKYEDIKLYRSVDGLVSYNGTDPKGNEVKVENILCTFRGKGANFMPFSEEYTKLMPKGSLLWDFNLKLGVTRHKNDPSSAVYYYVARFDPDFTNKLTLDIDTFGQVKELKRRIDATNKEINKKYYQALEEHSVTAQAEKVIEGNLNEDFDDDEEV